MRWRTARANALSPGASIVPRLADIDGARDDFAEGQEPTSQALVKTACEVPPIREATICWMGRRARMPPVCA